MASDPHCAQTKLWGIGPEFGQVSDILTLEVPPFLSFWPELLQSL